MKTEKVASHIGIVGCSPPGAALCYQIICTESALPGLEVSSHSHPFREYMRRIRADDWHGVADLMLSSAAKLALLGADFCVAPCNTIHLAFDLVRRRSPVPWLHIAEEVALEARQAGYRRVALLGTKLLMESEVYPNEFARTGIEWAVPTRDERERIDNFIFAEMVHGRFTEPARSYLQRVIDRLHADGCDAVGMCCTELPMLLTPADISIPILDSTKILGLAALKKASMTSAE